VGFSLLRGCSNVFRSQRKRGQQPGSATCTTSRGELFSIGAAATASFMPQAVIKFCQQLARGTGCIANRPFFRQTNRRFSSVFTMKKQEAQPAGTSRTEHSQAFVNNHAQRRDAAIADNR